jgi:hypothetical protein
MLRWVAAAALLAGCKKEVVDTGPTGSCEDIQTQSLTYVPATDYPEGLADELDIWRGLPGTYEADYCGRGTITVKLDNMPTVEQLQIVTSGVDTRIPCGCTTDPNVAEDDNALGAHTWAYDASVFLFDAPSVEETAVAVEDPLNGLLVYVDWALLPTSAPVAMRGCAKVPIEDETGTYTNATVVIRVSQLGALEGTVDLTGDGSSSTCDMTAFTKISEI